MDCAWCEETTKLEHILFVTRCPRRVQSIFVIAGIHGANFDNVNESLKSNLKTRFRGFIIDRGYLVLPLILSEYLQCYS
jgi:hypothetical protein